MNSIKQYVLAGLSALALAALAAPASAAQGQITAQIEPRSISLGDSAQLSVTVSGSRSAEPNVPHIDGLAIVPVGQQSAMRMINGAVTSNVSHIYQVTSNHAGNFTIPAITAPGAGAAQPIAFRVDQGGSNRAPAAPSARRSQPASPGAAEEDTAPVDAKNQPAFLRVTLPKGELTVGELVPVEVKAYFRAGVSASLNGLPMLSSDAFSLNKLSDQPEQTREKIDGVPYSVVTWSSSLSAVKAGEYPLNLDLPVMVRVQEPARRRSGGGRNPFKDFFGEDSPFGDSLFDDSFFDNFFGGMTEPMTLHTDGAVVKIKPLPAQGRPAGFSGAVGTFDVTSEAPATNGATGDPMKLKVIVTGTGNFSRVSTDGLRASAAWKTYKPSGKFEPTDSSGVTGSKTFEQSIIPMHPGAQEIPPVSFSYFDPEKDAYVTTDTKPIAVEIAPGAAAPAASTVAPPPATAPADAAPSIAPDGLAADEAVPARPTANLRPLALQPWFIALNAAMLVALVLGAIVRAIRARREQDPELLHRGAAERAVTESLAAMDAALAAKDAPRFFDAARHALQERLAAQWHVPASRVTIPEIRARLNGSGEDVRAVFQTADEIAYSGRRFTLPDLQKWRDLVQSQLQRFSGI